MNKTIKAIYIWKLSGNLGKALKESLKDPYNWGKVTEFEYKYRVK